MCTCLKTAPQYDVDSPKLYIDKERPNNPVRRIGLRPTTSESLLHSKTVTAWVAKKMDC